MANGADHWFHRAHASQLGGPDRLLLRRVRLPRVAGHLLGRPGRARRRPHEERQRHGAARSSASACSTARATSARRSTPTGTRSTPTRTSTWPACRSCGSLDRIGDPLNVPVELPGRTIHAAVWMRPGRAACPVLLLDTDIPDNDDADRPITHILYVRGREMRLHQELVLGVGGVRALRALGIAPAVWHLNEGHSAFLLVERARELVAAGTPLDDALGRGQAQQRVHDPHPGLGRQRALRRRPRAARRRARSATATAAPGTGGVPIDEVLELGRGVDGDAGQFDMTAFSLRLTNGANAVSQAPRRDRQRHLGGLLGGRARSSASPTASTRRPGSGRPMRELFERYLDADLDDLDGQSDARALLGARRPGPRPRAVGGAPAPEARARDLRPAAACVAQFARHGEAPATLDELEQGARSRRPDHRLRPPLRDLQAGGAALHRHRPPRPPRLRRGAAGPVHLRRQGPPGRPARPAGHPGDLRPQPLARAARPRLRPRGLRHADRPLLVQGVDVWLNNPRRPLEASGHVRHEGGRERRSSTCPSSTAGGTRAGPATTAGPSAAASTNPDEGAQDWADALDLYRILEEEVVPRYYDARRRRPAARLAGADEARHGHARSGASRRRGCSTSTPSCCTCRRPASTPPPRRRAGAPSPRPADRRRRLPHEDPSPRPPREDPWRRASRSPSRSTTTSRWATSAGSSPRSTSGPTSRCSTRSSATRASASALHYTGPLLEWLRGRAARVPRAPRARSSTRGQVELLGGGYYEPVLASLPERDRVGQLTRMADELERIDRPPAARRLAGRAGLGAGPADVARRPPATAGRSSTTTTSAPPPSPRSASGAPTRPTTRATC